MTGLLSVFSLLSVQALKKKKDDGEEQDVEGEEESGHPSVAGSLQISMQDNRESSDKDAERYNGVYAKIF